MDHAEVMQVMQHSHAYQEGHFRLAGGRHTNRYVQCAHVTQNAAVTEKVCRALAEKCSNRSFDLVVSPALGGMILGYEMSRILGIHYVYTERRDGAMTLRRGFSISKGAHVLIVEDVVTTGGSVREVMEIVRAFGGEVEQVACLVDRSNGKVDLGVPFTSLISYEVEIWPETNCPLCSQGIPITKPAGRD